MDFYKYIGFIIMEIKYREQIKRDMSYIITISIIRNEVLFCRVELYLMSVLLKWLFNILQCALKETCGVHAVFLCVLHEFRKQ